MKVTIKVTQKHINEGLAGSCRFCPIAIAVKEIFPEHDVRVGTRHIRFADTGQIADLPEEVGRAIRLHDQRAKEMSPMEFEVEFFQPTDRG